MHEIYSICEPAERRTCHNKDIIIEGTTPADCIPGCVCKAGYIFDTLLNKCVLPSDCSCSHNSKIYETGEKIPGTDCNTCTCTSGKWSCTKKKCSSTCFAWGDSHFHTFDGMLYDFEGVCSYMLSRGQLSTGDRFSIELQNKLCGLDGVSCSKSITIKVNNAEPLKLEEHLPIPGITNGIKKSKSLKTVSNEHLSIHVSGIFIVVEARHLGIQVKWDRGTRIYVTLQQRWMGITEGLCGNYNMKSNDDMKTTSGAIETSPALFGYSWGLQNCEGIFYISTINLN